MLRKRKIKKFEEDGDIRVSVENALKNVRKNTILEDEQDRLSKSVNDLNRQLESLTETRITAEKQTAESVRKLEVAKKDEEQAKKDVESVLAEKKEIEEALPTKAEELSVLNSELIETRNSYEEEKVKLSADISAIKDQKDKAVKNLNDEINRIKGEIDALEVTKQEIRADIEKAKGDKTSISNAITELEKERESKEQTLIELGDVDAKKAEVENLRVQKDELSTENEEVKEEIRKIKAEGERLLKKNIEISEGKDEKLKELAIREEKAKERELKLDIRNADINKVAKTLQKHLDKLKIPIKVI